MKYFAYGSNCNPAVLEKKGVHFTTRERATLSGYRLLFNKKSLRESLPENIGFANINEDPEGSVEGILYDIVDEHLPLLDASERYPEHYGRVEVTVTSDSGETVCCAYKAQPDKVAEGLVPSRNYLNHILSARDFLSQQYFEALDKSQTYHADCVCCGKLGEVIFLRENTRMYMLCQPCREAQLVWGDVRGRRLSVPEAAAVMKTLVQGGAGYDSIQALIAEAVATKIIDP